MRLLALDTAASRCSVALLLDGSLAERDAPAERVQAESVLPMVEELLSDAGLHLKDLDAIAFGRGPGAFTGLRVAAAVAQGLAYGAGRPVVPVSNLAALAYAAGRRHRVRHVLACLDARMQEVYWAAFAVDPGSFGSRSSGSSDSGLVGPGSMGSGVAGSDVASSGVTGSGVAGSDEYGSIEYLSEEGLCPPGEITPPPPGRSWFGAGSGWNAYGDALKARVSVLEGVDRELMATAGDIARLAEKAFKRGLALPPKRALPVYLRDNVATPKL